MSTQYHSQTILRHKGRAYTLFRRVPSKAGNYYFRVQIDGKRKTVCTETPDATLAKARARVMVDKILSGNWESRMQVTRRGRKVPTVGRIIDTFLKGDQHVRENTAKAYTLALLNMLRTARDITDAQARKLSIEELTKDLVKDYQAVRQGREFVDYTKPLKVNTSTNAIVRNARAIFSRHAMNAYEEAGMDIPDTLQGFLKAPLLKEVSHRYSDNPIPKEAIDAMNDALPALKMKDERLWAIHLMIRLMGLRASEAMRARRHWLVKRGDQTFLVINRREGEAAPKRQDGEVPVPPVLLDWFMSEPSDYLIRGETFNERERLVKREHSKWVRKFLPGRTKTNHELRKYAGSVVATKTGSYERAAEFLRIDIETAKEHYLAFLEPIGPLTLEDQM